jgi:tRNA nucleotidyltransferase/poly(A) polymerase
MDPQEMVIPTGVRLALDRLDRAGYEAYIVGGCVRDSLLGETPTDWDLATSASPERIKEVFNGYNQIDTGIRHGTITVILDDMPIEITTYRVDGKYSDGRRPDEVHFTGDIVEDLARRDFTINACAMTESEVIDPFGGKDDLRHGIIRSVGDPKERFKEDALRILRGIRFASVLGFKVEEETKKAILDCRELIRNVSMERITMEFSKILLGDAVYDTLLEFQAVMAVVFPEIQEMVGFDQRNKYHIYDVYRHTLKSVESIDKDVALRTTMFFHDIAKPSCFTLDGMARDEEQFQRYLKVIHDKTNRLDALIDDLFLYSQMELGNLKMNLELADSRVMLEDIMNSVSMDLENETMEMVVKRPFPSVWVRADIKRINQVVDNILQNAVKYAENCGVIEVMATVDDGYLEISISDNGIGIAREDLSHIFELFYRGGEIPIKTLWGYRFGSGNL